MREGLRQVKSELGPEAIILHSRRVRKKGIAGFFAPAQVEITAALDGPARIAAPRPGAGASRPGRYPADPAAVEPGARPASIRPPFLPDVMPGGYAPVYPGKGDRFWRVLLERHDVDPDLVDLVFHEAEGSLADPADPAPEALALALAGATDRRMPRGGEKTSRIQVFVGPTGVGKTTTLAKLAARYAFFHHEKVGLITVDRYRVGAVEQLATYAEIMGLPLEIVVTPRELPLALSRLEACRRILVDTAGRPTGDYGQIQDLAACVRQLLPAEVFLVLSATTRRQDLRLIAENFANINYNRLIITKLDETGSFGALLNAPHHTGCPLVYLTDGQNVPEDLRLALEQDLVALFFGEGGVEAWPTRQKSCGSMPVR